MSHERPAATTGDARMVPVGGVGLDCQCYYFGMVEHKMTQQTELIMRMVAGGQLPDGIGPYLLTLGADAKPDYNRIFDMAKATRG